MLTRNGRAMECFVKYLKIKYNWAPLISEQFQSSVETNNF